MTKNDSYVTQTKSWIENMVIKHNFCPFAHKPFKENKIRYFVSEATELMDLVDELVEEALGLADANPERTETSIVILKNLLKDFSEYNQFLDIVDQLIKSIELEGIIQIASFHPDYCFADLDPEDVRNYTNRSPYPMFHLIREQSIEAAREQHPDVESIPEQNMELLLEIGIDEIKKQLKELS